MFALSDSTQLPKENKMGVMPIGRLLITMSLPVMISMLVQALYNVVDSIFVAQISESALTAVSLTFPVQNLMIAIGGGTAVGINALLSRSLGEKNYREVDNAANNGVFLALMSGIVFLILGVLFSRSFFQSQTGDAEIVEYGVSYLSICSIGSFALFGQITFERLLQSTGRSIYSMVSQITGAVLNIILDPIMIFGLLGFPAMGVAGAALATVIGQFCGMALALYLNIRKNSELHMSVRGFRPRWATIRKIYSVGLPSIIMVSIGSVMIYGMNGILMRFTSTAAAVLGVYFKLQSFVFMPVFGLNNGLVPIVAYNYGARKKRRMIDAIRLSMIYAMSIMLLGFLVFQIYPDRLLLLFNASPDMLTIGIHALRRISISYLLAGFCIISGTVFQALGHGFLSLFCSLARQLLALLPVAYLLSLMGNLDLVWFSFPIAEAVSVVLSVVFLRYVYRTSIAPLP